jgi:hypothetical protein
MIGTVSTSICKVSAEGLDGLSHIREWDRLDKPSLVLDEDPFMMRGERGHDILPFQLPADEVFGAVELDAAVTVDLTDERDPALGDGKGQMTSGIDVMIEREAFGQMAERRPEAISENAGEAGAVFGHGKAPAGLLGVIIAKEAAAAPAQSPEVRATVKENALLPESVEALHGGVPAGLPGRDEEKMDPEQEMETDDLGDAVAIPAPSGRGHLVVHLGDPWKSHKAPAVNEMAAEGDRLFIGGLAGRGGLTGNIDGVEGVIPGDAPGAPEVSGPDHVGLLEIAHFSSPDVGIRGTVGRAADLDPFRPAGPGQDLFDGRDRGQLPDSAHMELMMDRLGADPRERGPEGLVGRQFVPDGQDPSDQKLRCLVPDMSRGPALVPKARNPIFSIAAKPFGKPVAAPTDPPEDFAVADPALVKLDGPAPNLIFVPVAHRLRLLPSDLEGSLSDDQFTYRCPYGFLHIDVLTETP